MGLIATLLQGERRSNPPPPDDDYWYSENPSLPGMAGSVSPDTALTIAAVYCAVRLLAESVAQLPLVLYRRLKGGGKERATDHPLYKILHRRPNEWQTSFEYREMLQGHLGLRGNAYTQIERRGSGEIVALIPLNPARMRPKFEGGVLKYLYSPQNGPQRTLRADQVSHLRGLSSDGLMGLSPVTLARETLSQMKATQGFGVHTFTNASRPSGLLKHPGKLSDPARDNLKKSWREQYSGAANAGKTIILEEGMDWTAVGMSSTDVQFLETRKFDIAEIARWFNIPPHMLKDLEQCMPADTLVYTERGPKRIVDVAVGEQVWSAAESGELRLARVSNKWDNGAREVLEIATTNRRVRCTAKHRLLVRRRSERRLRPGERGGTKRVEWRNEYVLAGDLRVGDTLVTLGRLPAQSRSVAPNGRILTEGFMEFCGLLVGDGNVLKNTGVTIARSASATYMDHYREVMRAEFSRYDGGNGRGNLAHAVALAPVTLVESVRQTKFASVLAAAELTTLGFAGTAFTKRVPAWVFAATEDLQLAFLRGYLDADGTLDRKGRITFYSVNRALIDDVRHLCMGLGVPVTNRRFDDQVGGPPFMVNTVKTRVFRFTCSDPGANRRIGSHDTRYQARLLEARPFGRKDRGYPRHGGNTHSSSNLALARVRSITAQPAEPVFDLEVEGTHSFIADGVISHNSTNNNIEQQSLEYVVYSLMPWLVRWEQALSRDFLAEEEQDEYLLEFLVDGLLRGDALSRSQALEVRRRNGTLNADEWRAIENMNPLPDGQGKAYLVPLNMVPADQAAAVAESKITSGNAGGKPTPDAVSTPAARDSVPDEARSAREIRSLTARKRTQAAHRRTFADAAGRYVRSEVAAIRRAVKKSLGQRDSRSFVTWLEDFYAGFVDDVSRSMRAPVAVLAEAVQVEAAEEIGAQIGMTPDLERFVADYVENMAVRHVQSSKGQILELLSAAEANQAVDDIEKRLAEWLEKRPEKIASRETVQAGEAVARETYRENGVRRLKWVTVGETCGICMNLNGRIIGIEAHFVEAGHTLHADGQEPMKIRTTKKHPPLHRACDCSVVAA